MTTIIESTANLTPTEVDVKSGNVLKRRLAFIVKFSFVAGLLYFLAKRGFLSVEATGQAFQKPEYIIPAFLCLLTAAFLGIIRWQWLLRSQGFHLKFSRVFQLGFIGNFFNITLPGAVSGDFVKAYYVGKEVQVRTSVAFSSILFDRVAGVSALVFLSATALLLGLEHLWGSKLLLGIQFFISIAALVTTVFYAYLFLLKDHYDPMLRLLKRLSPKVAKIDSIIRIYEGLRSFRKDRLALIKVLMISLLIHVLVCFACFEFARALGEGHLSFLQVAIVVPLGLLVTAIPVMPAGIGTGHAAFLALFALLGFQRGADIFSLFAVFQLIFGGVGGLIYLRYRGHKPVIQPTG